MNNVEKTKKQLMEEVAGLRTRLGELEETEAELRRTRESLEEKSMYLDNILASATEYSIATTDLDFRITYYNPMAEKLHGYKAEEVIGKTVQEIHTKEKVSPDRFDTAIENIRKTGEHCYTIEKETPEGTRYVYARVSGIYDKEKKLVGYANFAIDITEKKKAEDERARLINELKDALSSLKTMSGLIPICATCKKIRDDKGFWNHLELYIEKHSDAEFTHGICPECAQKLLDTDV